MTDLHFAKQPTNCTRRTTA